MPAKRPSPTSAKLSTKKAPVKPRKPVKAARPSRYSHPAFEDLEPQRPGLISRAVVGITDTASDLFANTLNVFTNHRNTIVAGAVSLLAGIYIGSRIASCAPDQHLAIPPHSQSLLAASCASSLLNCPCTWRS